MGPAIEKHIASEEINQIHVLAVEDDEVVLGFLATQIDTLGHKLHIAKDGRSALDLLKSPQHRIDVVLMDWELPVMDGLTAVRHMKMDPELRNIPVVMLTGADKPEEIKKGIEAGVFYYLTKPATIAVLRSVLFSAVRTAQQSKTLLQEMEKHRLSFTLIDSCKFKFRTVDEAESLAVFIANFFPAPQRTLPGIGELLINAIEHGNLGIGYEKKGELLDSDTWRNEIERRQNLPENAQKYATVTIARKPNGVYLVIEDQGAGFNWKEFLHINPVNAGNRHGRGIAQAKAVSFDKLIYNEKGNKAVAFVGNGKRLEW